ncbi:MAG: hypothetical protein ACOY82_06070 [Pseudomonadota bacterium]
MASAWIRTITNSTQLTIRFIQSDPMMHPVIEQSENVRILEQNVQNPHGVQVQSGQTIEVGPGGSLTASWFAIPWQGYGKLVVQGPHSTTIFMTGPKNGSDYLIVNGTIDESLRIGGQNAWQNLELFVDINTEGRPVFRPGGLQDLTLLQQGLWELGKWILDQLFKPKGQQPS